MGCLKMWNGKNKCEKIVEWLKYIYVLQYLWIEKKLWIVVYEILLYVWIYFVKLKCGNVCRYINVCRPGCIKHSYIIVQTRDLITYARFILNWSKNNNKYFLKITNGTIKYSFYTMGIFKKMNLAPVDIMVIYMYII